MGVKMMKVPEEPYVRLAGVLPDRERMIAYEAADVTIAPASDDLLAQPLLESLAVGTPVLASARNAAAVEHCRRANAGLYYREPRGVRRGAAAADDNTRLREKLGENGRSYIRQYHRWDARARPVRPARLPRQTKRYSRVSSAAGNGRDREWRRSSRRDRLSSAACRSRTA